MQNLGSPDKELERLFQIYSLQLSLFDLRSRTLQQQQLGEQGTRVHAQPEIVTAFSQWCSDEPRVFSGYGTQQSYSFVLGAMTMQHGHLNGSSKSSGQTTLWVQWDSQLASRGRRCL